MPVWELPSVLPAGARSVYRHGVNLTHQSTDLLTDASEIGDLVVPLQPIHQNPRRPHQVSRLIASVGQWDRNLGRCQRSIEVQGVEIPIVVKLQGEEAVAEPHTKEFARTARPL